MGSFSLLLRRRFVGVVGVGLLLALLVPTVALAANTASFSSRTPLSGSWTTSTRPAISVTAHDSYGIRGVGAYSMTIDGTEVSVAASYLVTGAWNPLNPDYSRVRLTGRPSAALAPGTHKVTVRVRDLKGYNSSGSWNFTVRTPVTFSSAVPARGSSDDDARPSISLDGDAVYGAKGSNKFTMSIDGSAVTPVVTYATKYTKFRIAARALTSDLGVGVHTVSVSATDLKGNTASYAWSITVLAPPIRPMPSSIDVSECANCHVGYPTAHPMTACAACHSATAPPRPNGTPMGSYSPSDPSAHTLACAANPVCHRGGGIFPHVLDTGCARCHTGSYSGIPVVHSADIEPYHQSGSTFCVKSGCHVASMTAEHYRRTVGGVAGATRLSCETCHSNTNPRVKAAIAARSTDCESCHDIAIHNAAHAVTRNDTCAALLCHGAAATDLTAIHASCAVCHANTASAATKAAVAAGDKSCANCHGFSDHTGLHTVTRTDTCAATGCHGSSAKSLTTIHASCATCHGPAASATTRNAVATGNKDCAYCHGFTGHSALHVVKRDDTCASAQCHGSADTNLTTIHSACTVCHGDTASEAAKGAIAAGDKSCANCHGFSGHNGLHTVVRTDACTACHVGTDTNLVSIHLGVCATCHRSTVDAVKQAISTKRTDCLACHTNHDRQGTHVATPASQTITINGADYGVHGCAECHSPVQLVTLHANNCAACHTVKVATTLGGVWNRGCVQGGCHTAGSTRPMHKAIDTTHTVTIVSIGVLYKDCTTGVCHTGGYDVAKIHGGVGGPGCAACHGGTKVPTLLCGTVGCHDKTHDLETAHRATPASQTISINGVGYGEHGCTECHSPLDLRTLHVNNCNACHATNVNTTLGGDWAKGCVQGGCHTAGSSKPIHKTLDTSHTVTAQSVGATYKDCTNGSCHAGGYDVAKIHGVAGGPGCAACHGGSKVPTLACSTVGCHDKTHDLEAAHAAAPAARSITIKHVVYDGHTCVECHAPLDLRTLHANNCNACHTANVTTTLGGVWAKGCVQGGCHTVGSTKPVHKTIDASHTVAASSIGGAYSGCAVGTCHPDGHDLAGDYDVAKIHGVAGGPGCAACHGGTKIPSLDCSKVGCHAAIHDPATIHKATPASETISINGVPYGEHGCSECHAPLDLRDLHGAGDASCATCHTVKVKTTLGSSWTKGCVQGGCHTAGSTRPMHNTLDTSHTVTAQIIGATYKDCTDGVCHTGGYDVAKIHAPKQGCASCHGGSKVPTLACASCHANLDHFGKHAVPARADECVDCHAGTNLTTIQLSGGTLSAKHAKCPTCHDPVESSTVTSATIFRIALAIKNSDRTCDACHASLDHTARHDVLVRGDYCFDCHAGSNLTVVHDKVRVPCAKCHAPVAGSKVPTATLAAAIAGNHKECNACHASAHTASHQWCNNCHTTLAATTYYTSSNGDRGHDNTGTIPGTNTSCFADSCHGRPFRPLSGLGASHSTCANPACHLGGGLGIPSAELHTVTRGEGCEGCHEGTNLTMIRTSTGTLAAKHGVCATCHAPTSSTISSVTIAAAISGHHKECTACHDAGAHGPKHDVVSPARADDCVACHAGTNLLDVHPARVLCTTCHESGKQAVTNAIANNDKRCATCHADAHQASHQWCNNCHGTLAARHTDPESNHASNIALIPNGTCVGCHGNPFAPLSGIGTSHPSTPRCTNSYCHSRVPTSTPTAELHSVVRTDTCKDCHKGANLTVVQTSKGALAAKHGACATCHAPSASSKVPTATIALAIAQSKTACGACHDPEGHGPKHDVLNRNDTCVGCHAGTNLMTVQTSQGALAAKHGDCATCHAPTSSKISSVTIAAAISGHHKECSACHGTGHDFPALHAASPASQTISILGVDYGKRVCSECHSPLDLRSLHGVGDASCAKCHTSRVNQTLGGEWLKGCVQGDCHKLNTAQSMHLSIDTSHTTPAAALSGCSGSSCHGNLSNSVAEIHAAHGGCPDCHASGKTPSLVCSSCHTPHPDIYGSLHVATMAPANFTFNGVDFGTKACSTCHASTSLLNNHATAGACGACHPGIKTKLGGTGTWNKSCIQGTCHGVGSQHPYHSTINNHSVSATGCNATGCHSVNVAAAHVRTGCPACHAAGKPALTTDCTVCHGGSGLAKTVTDVAAHIALHAVPARGDWCTACHPGTNLTAVKLHLNAVPVSAKHSACATCHAPTSTSIPAAVIASAITTHDRNCLKCHDTLTHTAQHTDCNNCHFSDHYGGRYVGSSYDCYDCHQPGTSGTTTWVHPPACHCYGTVTYTLPRL